MKGIISLCVIFFVGSILQGYITISQSNNTPTVTITAPSDKSIFNWNSKLAYAIKVEDKEDGSSTYEEIADHEVFLKIKFLTGHDTAARSSYQKQDLKESPVLGLIKRNSCFNCHGLHTKIAAPTFESIATKYAKHADVLNLLSSKIINGSKGVWGDSQIMPSHPQLSSDQSVTIVKWILINGPDKMLDIQKGLTGVIKTPIVSDTSKNGMCLLIATYLDHGIDGDDRQEGSDFLVLKNN